MLDVVTFLMRWLFLSNLLRDVAEIQTLPQDDRPPPPPVDTSLLPASHVEGYWRDACLRGVLSCPPGTQRLLTIDAFRVNLVQELAQTLRQDADVLQRVRQQELSKRKTKLPALSSSRQQSRSESKEDNDKENQIPLLLDSDDDGDDDGDPFRDADLEIIRALESIQPEDDEQADDDFASAVDWFRKSPPAPPSVPAAAAAATTSHDYLPKRNEQDAYLSISGRGDVNASPDQIDSGDDMNSSGSNLNDQRILEPLIPPHRITQAVQTAQQTRDYLPQLVAAVLKSPPATNAALANPVQRLRQLLLDRCLQDPSAGIEMCWLLEAEVGRAWKTLFEHRQQTGRRLIVVLPAEKAAVLAKIGSEKHEAFDLLQDAEQATAYGYRMDEPVLDAYPAMPTQENRLPSSLSLRRCSHFGDTMHFVDRLTQLSLDLRNIPIVHRHEYLQTQLAEINRRIRRRMVTRGEISLDVDDHRGPDEWPSVGYLRTDMLRHSVHFPLIPQTGVWPTGEEDSTSELYTSSMPAGTPQMARVLNLVVSESRLLSSRERCPFLVHLEIADTDMDGSDARLYATGAPELGSTIEEALSLLSNKNGKTQNFQIPNELLQTASPLGFRRPGWSLSPPKIARGGWQAEQSFYSEESTYYDMHQTPYDDVRQQELEHLHQQMQQQPPPPSPQQSVPQSAHPHVSVGHELLDQVFGRPWAEKCRHIRSESPFGKVDGWRLASFIMKAGEDIRREALVMQIISKLRKWFEQEIPPEHRPYMRPYTIMCVGGDAGLVECLSDAKSVDEIKKRTDHFVSLREYFERAYGPPALRRGPMPPPPPRAITFETAQDNFLRSLVGYSLVCYILQIKDRHNANILMDREGHIMHIDFGFVLGDTPKMARVPIFSERAPFKLSQEFWDVLGGWNISDGGLGVRFCKMFELAFACASVHADEIASLVEATMLALHPNARTARLMASGVRSRLRMRGPPGSVQQKMFIMDLVNAALTSFSTTTYDWLQRNMNGYQ